MKLDDWIIQQHIAAGDWLAAANAVATLHGLPQLSLPADKISVHFNMSSDCMALAVGGTKYTWAHGKIYSGPSLAQGPWAVIWTSRSMHEVERLVDS